MTNTSLKVMQNTRIVYIDILKGIAIILVVIGHLIQNCFDASDFDNNYFFRMIYSFHMPFFMLISGYTAKGYFASWKQVGASIFRRAINLLLPFFAWAILLWVCFNGISINKILKDPSLGLWFLYALFFIYSIFQVFGRLSVGFSPKNRYIFVLAPVALLKVLSSYTTQDYGIGLVASHYIYFALGSILSDYKSIFNKEKARYLLFSFPLFVILSSFWYRTDFHEPQTSVDLFNRITTTLPYRLLILATAVSFLFGISIHCEKALSTIGLKHLGSITLGIYAVHQFLISRFTIAIGSHRDFFYECWGGK